MTNLLMDTANVTAAAPPENAFVARSFSLSNDGLKMSLLTLGLTVVLELASVPTVRKMVELRQPGAAAYLQGLACNLLNNGILGPMTYEFVTSSPLSYSAKPYRPWGQAAMTIGIVFGHAIFYYCAHRCMHYRSMFWAHRFHHRFNTYVAPSTANAVSLAEYTIAYMIPFVIGCLALRPDRLSLFVAVGIVSLNNLLIHMPLLHDLSERVVPYLGVSTAMHLEHHKRLTTHFAAPTVSIDRLLALVVGQPESWGKKFVDPADERKRA